MPRAKSNSRKKPTKASKPAPRKAAAKAAPKKASPKSSLAAAPVPRRPGSGRILPRKPVPGEEKLPPGATLADDPVASEIMRRLREALTPTSLFVKNTTSAHRKHASAKQHGGGHYAIFVVSDLFNGLNLVQRQQWIHSLLGDLLAGKKIHALEMKLKNTDEDSSL